MTINPYVRFFSAVATAPISALLIGVTFGRRTALFAVPGLFAAFLWGLVILALMSGFVWFAERGGSGAYRISRRKEPFWFWLTVALYGVAGAAFLSFYIPR